jgi:hypothetical protein
MERRAILRTLSAGVVGSVIGARPGFAAEPPPETLRLRTTGSKAGLCVMGRRSSRKPCGAPKASPTCLREAGMIKSTPQRLIAHGTDWRFLNELKKELKG